MTISHAFARISTDGQRGGSAIMAALSLPKVTPTTEQALLRGGVTAFLAGGTAVVMHALSVVTAFH